MARRFAAVCRSKNIRPLAVRRILGRDDMTAPLNDDDDDDDECSSKKVRRRHLQESPRRIRTYSVDVSAKIRGKRAFLGRRK